MDDADRYAKQFAEQERIIDPLTPSPNQRALKIWKFIYAHKDEIDSWDMVCFCVEYLGGTLTAFPFLKVPVQHIGQLIYNAHYYHTTELGLCPSDMVVKAQVQQSIGQAKENLENSAKSEDSQEIPSIGKKFLQD